MIHIRIDNEIENSKRQFACGIGPELPPGDKYWDRYDFSADYATCPDCNPSSQFRIGGSLYVKDPERFIPDCICIIGTVTGISHVGTSRIYRLDASVGRADGGWEATLDFREQDLGARFGTPISQLSGRPGHPGYDEFCRIARSWGYD